MNISGQIVTQTHFERNRGNVSREGKITACDEQSGKITVTFNDGGQQEFQYPQAFEKKQLRAKTAEFADFVKQVAAEAAAKKRAEAEQAERLRREQEEQAKREQEERARRAQEEKERKAAERAEKKAQKEANGEVAKRPLEKVLSETAACTPEEIGALYNGTNISDELKNRAVFIDRYHPDVLNGLLKKDPSGRALMHRLFNSKVMGDKTGDVGLVYWLASKTVTRPEGKSMRFCGRSGERDQSAVLCKPDGYYDYIRRVDADTVIDSGIDLDTDEDVDTEKTSDSDKKPNITEEIAVECAKDTLDVINAVYGFINDSVNSGAALDDKWYDSLNAVIRKECQKRSCMTFWYGESKNYQLRPYLVKYFHVLFPEVIAGFYSRKQITIALWLLGINYSEDLSLIENNGLITCKMKELITANPSGIRFAYALYTKVYKICDATNPIN